MLPSLIVDLPATNSWLTDTHSTAGPRLAARRTAPPCFLSFTSKRGSATPRKYDAGRRPPSHSRRSSLTSLRGGSGLLSPCFHRLLGLTGGTPLCPARHCAVRTICPISTCLLEGRGAPAEDPHHRPAPPVGPAPVRSLRNAMSMDDILDSPRELLGSHQVGLIQLVHFAPPYLKTRQ